MKLRMCGLRVSVLVLCTVCWPQTNTYAQMAPTEQSSSRGEKKEVVAESLIRQRVEELAKAIRTKNIDGVMSLYAPDIVSFRYRSAPAIPRG